MPQPSSTVNTPSTAQFLDAFSGHHFFRAIHPEGGPVYHFYGERWEFEPQLDQLNASGYSIYFTANDPRGNSAKVSDFQALRCIYQDADEGGEVEPIICGQVAHAVWETSPGKFQRVWLTEALPVEFQPFIHNGMADFHGHDRQCEGVQRLLRVPGYRNTKPEYDLPLSALISSPDRLLLPRLTVDQVAKHFGIGAEGEPNTMNAMEGIQRSGDQPRATVFDLQKEKAKRGLPDRKVEEKRTHLDLRDTPSGELPTGLLLDVLAKLDPDMARNEWRRVIGALHWMGEGAEWAEDVAERWSAMGVKFDPGSFVKHWRQLDGDHPNPTHWGTLQGMAGQVRDTTAAKSRRNGPAFGAFSASYPGSVPYRSLVVHWPKTKMVGVAVTADPDARENVVHLLATHGHVARYDEFQNVVTIDGGPISNRFVVDIWDQAHQHGLRISQRALNDFIRGIAQTSPLNPAVDYFNSLRGVWDGVPRLNAFPSRYLGSPGNISIGESFALFMVAVVRRTYQPGYKFDLMPIFEGKQGEGKSSLFKRLMPFPEWFSEAPRLGMEEKRLYALIQGKLVIEFAELSGKRTTEIERIKAFVSQTTDEFIPNYATAAERLKRVACFVGTTNDRVYLRDATGNRRFPIIPVLKRLSWPDLDAVKEQLWAEAVFLEDIFGSELALSEAAVVDMEALQESRIEFDVGNDDILDELNKFDAPFVTSEAIWNRMGLPMHMRPQRNTPSNKSAFRQLMQLMERHGWKTNVATRVDGQVVKGHSRHEKGVAVKEIVCGQHGFIYKSDLTAEGAETLS